MLDQAKIESALIFARAAIADQKKGGDHIDFVGYTVSRGNGMVFTHLTFKELLVLVEVLEDPDVRAAWIAAAQKEVADA